MKLLVFAFWFSVARTVVEPPELLHLSYVEPPKVEVPREVPAESESKQDLKSESKSSFRKTEQKAEVAEVKQEVKQPDHLKPDTLNEKKDVDRPPIFVTLQ